MKPFLWSILLAVGALVSGACQSAEDPVTDTNTNWLEECAESSSCGGLTCLCSVCTRECETDADCSTLGANAVCSTADEDSCGGDTVCVASGASAMNPDDSTDDTASPGDTASADDVNTPGGCSGESPLCSIECGQTTRASCVDGSWLCPAPLLLPCPPVASTSPTTVCEGEAPVCSDGCGGTLPGLCDNGTWTCSDVRPAVCPDGGGGTGDTGMAGMSSGGMNSGGTGGMNSGGMAGLGSGGMSGGGMAGMSSGGVGGGGTTSTDPCETAEEGQACDVEGTRCGECGNDPCVFCNIMGCDQGVWQRFEAAPAPCFECGVGLSCQETQTLCRIENGAVYDEACVPVPEACTDDLSCGCFESEMPEFTCTEVSPTAFVLERSDSTSQ